MPIRREKRITRAMLRAEPDVLWVYGDNLARIGLGGQAAEMRGEPNAVGIPTKHRPARDPGAYFTNVDLDAFRAAAAPAFVRLAAHLRARGMVVWPADGIGTGSPILSAEPRAYGRAWNERERALSASQSAARPLRLRPCGSGVSERWSIRGSFAG